VLVLGLLWVFELVSVTVGFSVTVNGRKKQYLQLDYTYLKNQHKLQRFIQFARNKDKLIDICRQFKSRREEVPDGI